MVKKKRETRKENMHKKKKSEKFNDPQVFNFNFHFLLVVSGRELLVGLVDEDEFVDKPSKPTTDERPNPVDPVVLPAPAHNSWSE